MEIRVMKREPLLLAEDGVMLAESQIALPTAIGEDRASRAVNRFYGRIGSALDKIAKNVLIPQARLLYKKSDDPRKRFTHRPFRLICECRITEEADGIAVARTVTVRHRGRVIFERTDCEKISTSGLVLPIKQ